MAKGTIVHITSVVLMERFTAFSAVVPQGSKNNPMSSSRLHTVIPAEASGFPCFEEEGTRRVESPGSKPKQRDLRLRQKPEISTRLLSASCRAWPNGIQKLVPEAYTSKLKVLPPYSTG